MREKGGEWGKRESREGERKSQYFLVPIPMKRIVVGSRFGENQPTQHHRLGAGGEGKMGTEELLAGGRAGEGLVHPMAINCQLNDPNPNTQRSEMSDRDRMRPRHASPARETSTRRG
jgi:hypothetical protein